MRPDARSTPDAADDNPCVPADWAGNRISDWDSDWDSEWVLDQDSDWNLDWGLEFRLAFHRQPGFPAAD